MAQKQKRIRRATLRGWWKNVPFIVLPLGLFMSFAYLETARLQNQYEQSEVISYINLLTRELDHLRANNRELTNMERMDDKSGLHQLRAPDPNQVIPLSSVAVESAYAKVKTYGLHQTTPVLPTRTVMLHVSYEQGDAPDPSEPFAGSRIAQGEEAHGQKDD